MNIEGFTPLFDHGEYEAYRTRQVSLANLSAQDAEYQLVGRLDSLSPEAALIDITDIRTFAQRSGRIALHAMLLRDATDIGVRPFEGYEDYDSNDRLTLYSDNPDGLQLFIPQYGRFQLSEGYLIALAGKQSELTAHNSVMSESAAKLEPIDYFTGGPYYMR